jgi:hypothetical protein
VISAKAVLVLSEWEVFFEVRKEEALKDFGRWAEKGDWSVRFAI